MTREDAIHEIRNANVTLVSKEAKEIAIKALEQELVNISCKNCKNFNPKDNYCSLLQINWLPDDFGCVKKEGV